MKPQRFCDILVLRRFGADLAQVLFGFCTDPVQILPEHKEHKEHKACRNKAGIINGRSGSNQNVI